MKVRPGELTGQVTIVVLKHWPLIASLGVYLLTMVGMAIISVRQNQGTFVYALDDSYIHMAIAKSFAQHGVWGETRYNFTSTSSSPLWTAFLSLVFRISGVREISPFILNIVFGLLTLYVANIVLKRSYLSPLVQCAVLLAVIFVTPLPAISYTGMEHILHILLSICFVHLAARILPLKHAHVTKEKVYLLALSPLLTTVRYEGLFLLAVVGVLLALGRKIRYSLALVALGLTPLVVVGMISVGNGWYFLPNSLVMHIMDSPRGLQSLKGIVYLFAGGVYNIVKIPEVFVLVLAVLIMVVFRNGKKQLESGNGEAGYPLFVSIMFLGMALLHVQFASTGSFFRYEGYIFTLGILAAALGLQQYIGDIQLKTRMKLDLLSMSRYVAVALIILVLLLPLARRAFIPYYRYFPDGPRNIYEQHYQMGLFLREFYQGEDIAIQDIGAVSFLPDIRTMDLGGLGDIDVLRARLNGTFSTGTVYDLARSKRIKVAIVHGDFGWIGGLPPQWQKVGQWRISNNVVTVSDTVSFYATIPSEVDRLIANLRDFSPKLPRDVVQSGLYMQRQESP